MNYPDTALADLPDFSLWPDASAVSEETAVWSQAAGYTQPGLAVENVPLDVLDADLAWGQSGVTHAGTFDFQTNFDINWASGGTEMSSQGVSHSNLTAMGTLAPATTPAFSQNNMDAYTGFLFPQPDYSISNTPSLTSASSLPSPQSDGVVDGLLQFPILEAPPSNFIRPPGRSFPQLDIAGALDPNRAPCAPPTWCMGDSSLAGQVQSEFDPLLSLLNEITYPAPWELTQPAGYLATPTEALTPTVTLEAGPSTSLGKRSRQSDEDRSGGPKKRGRPNETRVHGGAESTKRTRRDPATRTRTVINSKSKAAGRRAERLAFTTAQGVYHRSLPGLSVPQGSVGALEQEQPSWVEEREQIETRRDTGSSAPQQIVLQENAEDEEDLREIPGNLSERERLMLQMTQAEKERGAVRVIKCKLCPKPRFGTWLTFRRHCKSCEQHPSEVKFCPRCGDYFGRPDSRGRHEDKKHQEACLNTPQHEARQKREKVERLLKAFEPRLTQCLRNGEDIQPRFSQVINKIFSNTSKKATRSEEISLEGDSWAAGLC